MNLDDKIGYLSLERVVRFVEMAVEEVLKLPIPAPEKKGGQFFLLRLEPRESFIAKIGEGPDEKAEKLSLTAAERALRLLDHLSLGHVSSYQSRDPKTGKRSGAILGDKFILSFAGLPEWASEAVMLVTAYRLGLADVKRINDIRAISINPYFEVLNDMMYMKVPEVFGLPEHLCPSVWKGTKLSPKI